jgi:chromosomal replication initiator protein
MNEMIEAISQAETASFKDKYRKADVLLIDDIQFLAGKPSTQEEFFHTFSTLYEAEKQIILTSDRPPKDIRPLEDRLRSRFEGGLIAEVSPPSFELRTAIIKKKSSSMNLLISNELVDYMAERLQRNIRQIEGVLKRLYALYSLSSTPVTKESIDEAISFIDPGNIPIGAFIEKILGIVSKHYDVSIEDLKSQKRTENIANARHVAIYIIKNLTNLSLKEIGNIFSGRNHATIISSINKVDTNIKTKKKIGAEINSLIKEIKEH